MAKDLALGIVIGASLSGGFHTAVGGAVKKLTTLGTEIKTLGARRGLIERVEKDRSALELTRQRLSATSREIGKLKLALAAGPPDRKTAKAMADARARADRLSAAIEKQRATLRASEQALGKAGLKVGDLAGEYARLGQTLDTTRAKHARLEQTMGRRDAAKKRLGELKAQVVGLGAAVYGAGKIIGEAMDFESAMADVRKVVDFPEPDGLVHFGATLKQMSREIPISAAGLAQIAAAGGQLGVAAGDLPAFTDTVAKMATAFDMLPDEAGDAMAKLANVYQIPIGEMGKLGDAINHLSDNTAAKARDIVPVLARAGGTARQFGLSAVQVAALGDAFVALGKPPEVAATAINAMLTKLQTATRQGAAFQKGLSAIGMDARQMEAAIADNGQAALEAFLETMAGIDKQERAGILADMFGMEYSDDIWLLTGSLDQYRKALALVADQQQYAGSMTREFANRSATTANQLQLMKNSVSVLAINLGSTLLPAINAVIRPVAAFAGRVGDLVERFPWVGRLLGGVAVGLGVFVGALGLAAAATWAWNAALLANPIGIVVAAIGGAAALVITFWEPIRTFFSGLWADIYSGAVTLWDGLRTAATEVVGAVMAVWAPVRSFFGGKEKEAAPRVGSQVSISRAEAPDIRPGIGASMAQAGPSNAPPAARMAPARVALQPVPPSAPAARQAGPSNVPPAEIAPARYGGAQVDARVTAPITIHAAPGQDPRAIAGEVDRQLRAREAEAAARARGALHD